MLDWLYGKLLAVGSPAPDFTLADDRGRQWTLSALRGRPVLLVFYPGDSTPTCTRQLCEIRDHVAPLNALNIQAFGINPMGAASHGRFRERYSLPFPLLADPGGRVCRRYRCGSIVVRRTVYLVGPDGRILYARRGMPATAAVLREAGLLPPPSA